jgi:hypothetical protein
MRTLENPKHRIGRGKKGWHESPLVGRIRYDSSWELLYFQWLDSKKILYRRGQQGFPYTRVSGKHSKYYPDIYLPETDEWVEIKSWPDEDDQMKWKAFPYKLTVLKKEQLIADPYNFRL